MASQIERVYLDSSILVGSVITGSAHSGAAIQFVKQIAEDEVDVVISKLARFEFANLARKLGVGERRKSGVSLADRETLQLDDWRVNFMTRQHWFSLMYRGIGRSPRSVHHRDRGANYTGSLGRCPPTYVAL